MRNLANKYIIGLLLLALSCTLSEQLHAQVTDQAVPPVVIEQPKPAMQNVFFNVLWGSFTGGILMSGLAMFDDTIPTNERYSLSNFSTQFLTGATYGGFLGLIAGVYLSFKEISFDEGRTRIAFFQPPQPSQSIEVNSFNNYQLLSASNPSELRVIDLNVKF